jgi:thiosulfate dehydrogenase (quinone) large subunit
MFASIKMTDKLTDQQGQVLLQDPPFVPFLFGHSAAAWFWLGVRLWLGYQWLVAASHKLVDPAWMDGSGSALLKYWTNALGTTPQGQPIITYEWYRAFLQLLVDSHAETWFSRLIVGGELAIGVATIVGAFVGVVAGGGLAMNFAYMLAGSTSSNPVLALVEVALMLAWKNAGYFGLDFFLLRKLGARRAPVRLNSAPRIVRTRAAAGRLLPTPN